MRERISKRLEEAAEAAGQLCRQADVLASIASSLVEVLRANARILVVGNGGSMAQAMHFAEEWTGKFSTPRRPYAVLALSDPTHLSCVANDFGFDHVFERGVVAFGRSGDALLVLSTSGASANVVRAARAARETGMQVVGMIGQTGGELAPLCDLAFLAPHSRVDRVQEAHLVALHVITEAMEILLGHGEAL